MRRGSSANWYGDRKAPRDTAGPLLTHEHQAIAEAERLRLWLLIEGPPNARVWTLYRLPRGSFAGTFRPSTGIFWRAGQEREVRDWRHALELAAARRLRPRRPRQR